MKNEFISDSFLTLSNGIISLIANKLIHFAQNTFLSVKPPTKSPWWRCWCFWRILSSGGSLQLLLLFLLPLHSDYSLFIFSYTGVLITRLTINVTWTIVSIRSFSCLLCGSLRWIKLTRCITFCIMFTLFIFRLLPVFTSGGDW